MTLAGDLGLEAREARISRDHLYGADEVFVCGTAAEVLGVVDIDGRKVGDGRPGPSRLACSRIPGGRARPACAIGRVARLRES